MSRRPVKAERRKEDLVSALLRHSQRARPGTPRSAAQLEGARAWALNGLARALAAGRRPELAHLLKPLVPGGVMPGGARVPGTSLEFDPVQAAFVNALLTSWECGPVTAAGHPCQHIGALLAVADAQARRALMQGQPPLTLRDLEGALLTSYEIQTGLAGVAPPLHGHGDPTRLLCVALAAVIPVLLGDSMQHGRPVVNQALSEALALPAPPEAADRRAATSASRAVWLALSAERAAAGDPVWAVASPQGPFVFEDSRLPELPGGPDEALLQLLTAASQALRPQQMERVHAFFAGPPEQLDTRSVSQVMAHLSTHAVREDSRQMTLLL